MTSAQKRKIALIAVLVLLLLLLVAYYLYYQSTKQLGFNIQPTTSEVIDPPQYLYSFSGPEGDRLQRPIGVLADGQSVFVVDSAKHTVKVFNEEGDYQRSFATTETLVPLNIAENPLDGNFYITDRRARTIHIFEPDGAYVDEFDPKLPEEQLPTFETGGVQWAPVTLAFADDGTMYVTEILKGHRLLIFDPDGEFQKSVGTVGNVTDAEGDPELWQFPNGIAVRGDEVYVTDSNNRRVKVYSEDGTFDRVVVTQGLPRGLAFLERFPTDEADTPDRYVVVDTLAHDGTIWSTNDNKIVSFGEQGILEGQFSYPNGVSTGQNNKIFITDTANGRVQVWGWPEQVSPVPIPRIPQRWWLCLLPLLLLPLLWLLRRRRFFATGDFIEEMLENQEIDLMKGGRRKWFVTQEDYERFKDVEQGEIKLGELLHVADYSESDAQALMEKLEIPHEQAVILTIAQRSKVFCTEDDELRRLAKTLEVDVINRVEFLERYAKRNGSTPGPEAPIGPGGGEPGPAPETPLGGPAEGAAAPEAPQVAPGPQGGASEAPETGSSEDQAKHRRNRG